MRPVMAGPGSSTTNWRPTYDRGATAPAAKNTGGFRSTGDAAGPTSAHKQWSASEDSGKFVGASNTATDGYRPVGEATGPTSSHKQWSATEDSGKFTGATATYSDGYRQSGDAAGPTSSHREYAPGEDSGKFAPAAGSDGYHALDQ